jgi:nucleotide-binding universal stress UspA family protein
MQIRDIMLCVEPVRPGSVLIDNAVRFARKREANLTGLYPIEIFDFPGYVQAQLPKEVLENYRKIYYEEAQQAEAAFRDACTSAGIHWDWHRVEGERAQSVIENGRLSDLVMLAGGHDGDGSATGESAGRIMLECGRPVLLLPAAPIAEDTGSRILLAWNGRREAVRAVHDALPLLEGAEWVKIVLVNPDTGAPDYGDLPGSELCRHLARHGVKAEAQEVRARGKSDGAALLDLAKEEGANLVVMGAYGHARWRELVIGGVTEHVLRHAELPIFLSH